MLLCWDNYPEEFHVCTSSILSCDFEYILSQRFDHELIIYNYMHVSKIKTTNIPDPCITGKPLEI